MTAPLKIVGYIAVSDLEAEHVDLDHVTGLSGQGYDELVSGEEGAPLTLQDLSDVDVTLEK